MTLQAECKREVEEFHEFIETWLAGRGEQTDAEYERATTVLPEEFEIISPSGKHRDGAEIRADLRAGHGAFADSDPAFQIQIQNVQTRFERPDSCLVTYEEWQRQDGNWEGRVSSALFQRAEGAPNGVEWRHLHETWLPEDADGPA